MATPTSPVDAQPTVTPAEGAPSVPEGGQPAPAEPTHTPPTPTPVPATEPTTAPAAPAGEPGEPKGKAPRFEGEFDPARFERLVENLRGDVEKWKAKSEAAEQRAGQQQADLVKRFAEAFGLAPTAEKPPTPEELASQLEAERTQRQQAADQAQQTQVELAVYRSAGRFGGDPDALLDSRSFANRIAKLDPAAGDFTSAVEAAVKAAVEANPKLAAKQPEPTPKPPAPKGGADLSGAPGGKRQLGAADVARMTPEQIVKAREAGQLNAYLGRGG